MSSSPRTISKTVPSSSDKARELIISKVNFSLKSLKSKQKNLSILTMYNSKTNN